MTTQDMTAELQDAWPDLPEGLKDALPQIWGSVADRIAEHETEAAPDGVHPLNEFTQPLAAMAAAAGFEQDIQGKEFIRAAMDAAGVPESERDTIASIFAAQLHLRP
ncbi:hypothetical protein ACIPYU_19660 [Paenarthrobacter nicotinovorans]|uniref:hypothetical protein n=1 Tax=Paenarthrobacter nicotinovorans TaxID=29320 RepID=UPI0037FF4EC8